MACLANNGLSERFLLLVGIDYKEKSYFNVGTVGRIPVCPVVFDRVVRAVMSLDRAHGKTLFSS